MIPFTRLVLSFTLLLACASLQAAIFKVGFVSGCTHRNLGAAIAAAAANGPGYDEIRIAASFENIESAGPYVIRDQSLGIRAGYPGCTSTSSDNRRLEVISSQRGSLFTITNTRAERTVVTLSNLFLKGPWGSTANSASAGGALRLEGNVEVSIDNLRLSSLRTQNGGAIHMQDNIAGAPRLYVANTELYGNRANRGGGLHCQGSGYVRLDSGTRVESNNAGDGGGIYSDGCSIVQQSGAEIRANAAGAGAGVYASNGAFIVMRWSNRTQAPIIAGNRASSWGGGMFLTGANTRLDARGGQWLDNRVVSASYAGEGAAILVGWGAVASLRRHPYCPQSAEGCSRIAGNAAETAESFVFPSIIDVRAGARLVVSGTDFFDNWIYAGSERKGALISVMSNHPDASTAELDNLRLRRNFAAHAFAAEQWTYNGQLHVGRIDAQMVTEYDNQFATIIGTEYADSVIPINLRASILLGPPILAAGRVANGAFDCLITRREPGLATSRSLIASDAPGSVPHVDQVLDYSTGLPKLGSPAVDFCDSASLRATSTDIRGMARAVDDYGQWDRYGNIDLGAFERAPRPDFIDPEL